MNKSDTMIGTVACPRCQVVVLRMFWRGGRRLYEVASTAVQVPEGPGAPTPVIAAHKAWNGAYDVADDLDGCTGYMVDVECRCSRTAVDLAKVAAALDGRRRRVSLSDLS